MRSYMCSLFISIRGRGWAGSAFFEWGGSVCERMCVYTHTHKHPAHSDVSTGVGTTHLEGPKNADGLNLGIYVFIYMYKVHMYSIFAGRQDERSWTDCFFLNTFFLPEQKVKRCKHDTENSNPLNKISIIRSLHPSKKSQTSNHTYLFLRYHVRRDWFNPYARNLVSISDCIHSW